MKHAYRPLEFYHGRVLKYAGMVDDDKAEFWLNHWTVTAEHPYMPGAIFKTDRVGTADRIFADTLQSADEYL